MKIFKKEQGFTRTPKFGVTPKGGGFTLIELLVVVAIIGIIVSVVLISLNDAKGKGTDAAVKENLTNAMKQSEIFYITNTASSNSYTNVCTNGIVGGVLGIGANVSMAARASGLSVYSINATGTGTTATCNSTSNAWAAEVPLKGSTIASPKMWCVDSKSKSKQESTSIGAGTVCN